ncbi:hypothetical protein BDZ89DRAFT_1167355 [Hymenopellis radicata]|nr:hypothetical protein BDZ89DRAFT_1167355 [Hymenopellis radicata]
MPSSCNSMVFEPSSSGIHSLPNELLVKVFHFLCESYTLPKLCAVCTLWRHVCLTAPALWAVIEVPFQEKNRLDLAKWVNTRISRAKACPIDIIMSLPADSSVESTACDIMQLAAQNIHRLRKLSISGSGKVFRVQRLLEPLLPVITRAPLLEELELHFTERGPVISMGPPTSSSPSPANVASKFNWWSPDSAPRLYRQVCRGISPLYPLVDLTSLELHSLRATPPEMQSLFKDCPSLATLVFRELWPVDVSEFNDSLTRVECLSVLSFTISERRATSGQRSLLSVLSFPNLQILEVCASVLSLPPAFVRVLENVHTIQFSSIATFPTENVNFSSLYSLSAVKCLKVHDSPCESIVGLPRRSDSTARRLSIGSRDEARRNPLRDELMMLPPRSNAPPGPTLAIDTWPLLRTITLSTIRAPDVQWLCRMVLLRPDIRRVELSHSALRHLKGTLLMDGEGDEVTFEVPTWRVRSAPGSGSGKSGVDRWLASRVDVVETNVVIP